MAVRVAPLSRGSPRRSSAVRIAPAPTTATPAATARSAPTLVADEASSSARSVASRWSDAASSLKPEVDDPGGTVVRQEDVGQPQVAVGDAVGAHPGELRPHLGQYVVGHLVGFEAVERASGDRLVRQHVPVGLGVGERDHAGGADAQVAGGERHQRLSSTARRSDENAFSSPRSRGWIRR